MVVFSLSSSASAASPKKKLSDIDSNALVGAIVSLWLADTIIRVAKPNDVKTDRIELAKELAPLVKGYIYG